MKSFFKNVMTLIGVAGICLSLYLGWVHVTNVLYFRAMGEGKIPNYENLIPSERIESASQFSPELILLTLFLFVLSSLILWVSRKPNS